MHRTVSKTMMVTATCALGLLVGRAGADDLSQEQPNDSSPMQVEDRLILTVDDLADVPQERLITMMGADLAWTRSAASQVLAKQGQSSIPTFKKALSDSDWRVVRAGQDGLLQLLKDADKAKEDELRKAVVEVLPDVQKTLRHEHYYVRMGALEVLRKLGADAAPAASEACALFTDKDFLGVAPLAVKTVAAIGVEHVDDAVLKNSLSQAIRSKDMSVRSAAISVVAKLEKDKQRTFIPDMLDALRTPMKDGYTRFHVQARVANVLYDLGEKEVLPLSIAILSQKGWGHSHRIKQFVPILEKFGPEAVSALPMLESYQAKINGKPEVRLPSEEAKLLEKAIVKIKGEPAEEEEK